MVSNVKKSPRRSVRVPKKSSRSVSKKSFASKSAVRAADVAVGKMSSGNCDTTSSSLCSPKCCGSAANTLVIVYGVVLVVGLITKADKCVDALLRKEVVFTFGGIALLEFVARMKAMCCKSNCLTK